MAGGPGSHNEHELGQTPRVGEGQGGMLCFSPRGCKDSGMTEQLNNNLKYKDQMVCVRVSGSIMFNSL